MINFEVKPFEGAGPLRFGMSPEDVHVHLGEPRASRRNRRGELDEDYSEATAGYTVADDRLVEVAFVSAALVTYCGVDLLNDESALSLLVRADGSPVSGLDIIVFPSLGIALTDYFSEQKSDRVVTVFARGRWDDLKGFEPFSLDESRHVDIPPPSRDDSRPVTGVE